MDQPEHEQDQEKPSSSLEGRGWDILAGGRENPFALGGDDPFDEEYQPSRNPFTDDDETDLILGVSTQPEAPPSPEEEIPADAFWDRGRGASDAEPSADLVPEPRDLSPEELAAESQPVAAATSPKPSDMGAVTPGVQVEVIGADEVEETEDFEAPAPIVPPPADEPVAPVVEPVSPTVEPVLPEPEVETGGPIAPPADEVYPAPVTPAPAPIAPEPDKPPQPPWPLPEAQSEFIQDPWARSSLRRKRTTDPDLPPYPDYEKALITKARVDELWGEIDETYDRVINDVRGHYATTDDAIADLKEARELLLAGPEHFDNAEELVMKVKARLRLEEKVRQWSKTWGAWLRTYLIIWLILLTTISLFTLQVEAIALEFVPDWMAATFLPGFFGGFGGVVGALWVLIKHTTRKRDFDPIHAPWYIVNPFLGIALGVLTYLVVRGGGVVLGNLAGTATEITFTTSSEAGATSRLLLYLLCAIVGFNQNVLWRLISRVMKVVFPEDQSEDEEAVTSSPDSAGEPVG